MQTTRSDRTLPRRPLLVGGAIAFAAAVVGGMAGAGGDRTVVLIPMAIALALAAAYLAAMRFELFVLGVILIRPTLDTIYLGSSTLDAAGAISVLFIGASCLWLLAQRDGRTFPPSPTDGILRPVAALFLCALISVIFSTHPLESLLEVVRFGTLIVILAVLGRLIRDDRTVRLVLTVAIASSIIPLLFAARQISGVGVATTATGLSRIRGTFLHSNPFAAYLFLMITLILSVFPHVERRWKLVLAPLGFACGGALLLTYSRGAWAATILAVIVIGLLQDRRLLWLLGVGALVIALAVPSVGVRLSDLTESRKETGAAGNSLIWRVQYWERLLEQQNNPILGIGFKEVGRDTTSQAHNDPIRVFVETGLLGLAAYVWLLIALGLEARSTLRRAPPGLPRGLAVAFAASLGGLVMLSLTANVITQLVILWYFMTIVALAIVRSRLPARRRALA